MTDLRTTTTTTRRHHLQLDKTKLLQLIAGSLDLSGVTPAQVSVTVRVPGGGDWSNTDLDLGDHPVDVRWTEEDAKPVSEMNAAEWDLHLKTQPSPQSPTAASADDVAAAAPVPPPPCAPKTTEVAEVSVEYFYEVMKAGSRARDTGAVSPYSTRTIEHFLHIQGWLTRDLQLALARSNPRYRAQQIAGGSITEEGIRGGYGFSPSSIFVEEKGQ